MFILSHSTFPSSHSGFLSPRSLSVPGQGPFCKKVFSMSPTYGFLQRSLYYQLVPQPIITVLPHPTINTRANTPLDSNQRKQGKDSHIATTSFSFCISLFFPQLSGWEEEDSPSFLFLSSLWLSCVTCHNPASLSQIQRGKTMAARHYGGEK